MVDLLEKKVGIVACSGEEMAEGTVTRLAALKVIEGLRPGATVTICLPLFLAGGEGDRAFARFYPTIAVDGCDQRCAARATEMYSGKPAASVVVTDLVAERGLGKPEGARRLNEAGTQAADAVALKVAELVDDLLGRRWDRHAGNFAEAPSPVQALEPVQATCSCGSGIPIQNVLIHGRSITLVGLPLIFQQFREAGREPSDETVRELLEQVKIYNPVLSGDEAAYVAALHDEYAAYCRKLEAPA
jgi:uncharacterized metal-binding protein